mmetsp:Transcript_1267/g.3013  ORF Transcript_1267/g.3013 Transcript_1267/m.3013 type:complete len:89 (+) Transcript_1267:2-268(+)
MIVRERNNAEERLIEQDKTCADLEKQLREARRRCTAAEAACSELLVSLGEEKKAKVKAAREQAEMIAEQREIAYSQSAPLRGAGARWR